MEDSYSITKLVPMLSPVMESELIRENWPPLKEFQGDTTKQKSDPPFWEEDFQDLSDWCVDPKSINRFPTRPPSQGQRDYHIGELIKSKNSGVEDNCDNLSYIKSELIENTGIGDNWTVEKNIRSTGMSLDGSMPVRQDRYNTVTDISDVWLDLLPTTSGINEQQTIDNMNITSNRDESATGPSLDAISNAIDNWLPNINIPCSDLNIDENQEDSIIDTYSTSFTSNDDDDYNKNQLLKDMLFNVDIEPDSFDLLSYVCDEGGNVLDRKNNTDNGISVTKDIAGSSRVVDSNKSKLRREKKTSKARVKAEPYVTPLKLSPKSKNLSLIKSRTSKQQADQESVNNCSESDSESHTSDYSYKELREKNNKASRKSRINKKVKETEMQRRANDLERDNAVLRMKVEELEKLVTSMRTALLQSALKKET